MSEKVKITEGSGSVYKDIGLPEPIVSMLFCDLRVVAVGGQFYPIQIAVLRVIDGESRIWSSRIYPALNWSTQVIDASPVDLSSAPPAADVASQVMNLIHQCPDGWIYSASSATAGLLERLLAEAEVGYLQKVEVLDADQIMQDDTSRRAMKQQLKSHKRTSDDPLDEVKRLWTCYQEVKSSEEVDKR